MFLKFLKKNKRIYFDNASAVPVSSIALKEFNRVSDNFFANSSSIHEEGEKSKEVLYLARKNIAKYLHTKANNIYFTSSTTEANNIFIKGVILDCLKNGIVNPEIIYSKSDHSSIVDTVESCKIFGAKTINVVPNRIGVIPVSEVVSALTDNTSLICFSLVSSETGAILPIKKIVTEVRELCKKNNWKIPKFFVDATQAIKYENLDMSNLLVDGLSFGGSKLGSVPGCAVLFVKNQIKLSAIISGGGQEEGVRSGTENLPAISALSETMNVVLEPKKQKENREYVSSLRNYCIKKLEENFDKNSLEIFGDTKFKFNKYFEHAAPHILLISLVDMLGEETLLRLDAKNISVSTASACSLLENSGSNFLISQKEPVKAKETIRLSFSENNNKKEIDYFVKVLKDIHTKFLKK